MQRIYSESKNSRHRVPLKVFPRYQAHGTICGPDVFFLRWANSTSKAHLLTRYSRKTDNFRFYRKCVGGPEI